jgi:hypothetical protein
VRQQLEGWAATRQAREEAVEVARRAVQRHAGQDQDDEGEAGWSHGTDGMQLRPRWGR